MIIYCRIRFFKFIWSLMGVKYHTYLHQIQQIRHDKNDSKLASSESVRFLIGSLLCIHLIEIDVPFTNCNEYFSILYEYDMPVINLFLVAHY